MNEIKSEGQSENQFEGRRDSQGKLAHQVAEMSAFWRKREQVLRQTQENWRGREWDYLMLALGKLYNELTRHRQILLDNLGYDVLTGTQSRVDLSAADNKSKEEFLLSVERSAMETMKISDMVKYAMAAAVRYEKDPVLTGYEMFFYAMNNVPQAETLFLMLDSSTMKAREEAEAGAKSKAGEALQEECNLLIAGWADSKLSLRGAPATRLWDGVKEQNCSPRESLRELLPGAVLEVAQEFLPGQELLINDRVLPQPGKATAGRQPRSLRSRIARSLERPTARPLDQYIDDPIRTRASSGAASDPRAASPSLPSIASAADSLAARERLVPIWQEVIRGYRKGTQICKIAEYLCQQGGVTAGLHGQLRLVTGVRQTIAERLGTKPETVSRQWSRIKKQFLLQAQKAGSNAT